MSLFIDYPPNTNIATDTAYQNRKNKKYSIANYLKNNLFVGN